MSQDASQKPKCPARPPPPDPSKLRTLRLSRLGHTDELQAKTCDLSLEDQNIPTYIDVLSDKLPAKDVAPARPPPPVLTRSFTYQSKETKDSNSLAETTDIENTETSWSNGNHVETDDGSLYADVLSNERRLRNCPTPPPRPVVPPRLTFRRKSVLCQSQSAGPTEHVYESIDDVLSQHKGGERRLSTGLTRKGRFTTYHSWSEVSSVDGDRTARELDILLEWWRSIGGLENLQSSQQEETKSKPLISVAQRVKTAMRLYELLLVQRCTDLLNNVTELHCTANSLVKSNKKARLAKLTGGTTGAVGGVTIAAGLALAPLTFGASLVATGIGVGIVAAGGVTGASASFSKKKKGNWLKDKVEKIINSYKTQIEDILACLRFIDIGMEQLRKEDNTKLNEMGDQLAKIGRVAQEMENVHSMDVISDCFGILEDLDFYFLEEDDPKTKKNSNTQLAQKVYEVADKLKECVDQLIRIKNLFRSVNDSV
ncbi:uncharacterized protein LOC113634490 [Tachysurus fulvidraco]|uniref:uncharacterized protein LOC113634490 n=1 Tax=Tachysurus fulvidraco TaxID=1234273 RepID=UPI000F50591B|nr:uncharacterized protein LOC113634490 [Tachysurus fulvidraco]